MRQVEDVVRTMPEVRMITADIGGADFSNGARNSGTVKIQLIRPHQRKRSQKQIEDGHALMMPPRTATSPKAMRRASTL